MFVTLLRTHLHCFADGSLRADMQSHPFTVLSYDSSAFPTEDEKSIDSPSEKMTEAVNSPERSVKMVIRPQKGITSTLMRNNEERKNVKVFVEGPYGAPFSLPTNCYDNVRSLKRVKLLF